MESARCRAFLAAVETGSFSKAAEKLSYTPSGVSQLVGALENDMGLLLLNRTKRGVRPTQAGVRLLPAVREFLQQEERIYQLSAAVKGLTVGEVTVGAYSSVSTHWLPGVICAFQADFPQVRIRLMEGIRQEVLRWLETGQVDVGFLSDQGEVPGDWVPLAEDQMQAVLPKTHPLAHAKSYPIERCMEESIIMTAMGEDHDVFAMFARHDLHPPIRYTTIETFSAMAMVEQGLGVTYTNQLITRRIDFDVVQVPIVPIQRITLGMALPSFARAAPAVRRFAEYAAHYLGRSDALPPE